MQSRYRTARLGAPWILGRTSVNGLLNRLQGDLADFALVGAGLVFHDGDAVLLVAGVPGLDGAPGELAGLAQSSSVKVIWLTAWMRVWIELPSAMSMAPSTRIFR